MKREKLFGVPLEEETFEEQMEALGVEVVKPKQEVEWYNSKGRAGKIGLKDKISVTAASITLGTEIAMKLGGEGARLKVAVVTTKKINTPDQYEIIFVLKPSADGLKITRSNAGSYRLAAKKMVQWLITKGVKKGRYNLKPIDGGYLAVPVGGGTK